MWQLAIQNFTDRCAIVVLLAVCLLLTLPVDATANRESPLEPKLLRVSRIWDRDPHSAFTDLIYWRSQFVCVFRTGKAHVSPDGGLQLLTSVDGVSWQPWTRLTVPEADLRDPKLAIGKQNELLLYATGAMHDSSTGSHRNYSWFSADGKKWQRHAIKNEAESWLWRVTAHETGYYGWGYGVGKDRFVQLFHSSNGEAFKLHTPQLLQEKGYANETAMVMEGKQAWCLLRRDSPEATKNTALLGTATEPFTNWQWRDAGVRIGGPSLLRLPAGQFLATVRLYQPKVHTALCQLDVSQPALKPLLELPSSGDSSYAGMVWHQQKLWISYYSSHEGKASIYLAEIELKQE